MQFVAESLERIDTKAISHKNPALGEGKHGSQQSFPFGKLVRHAGYPSGRSHPRKNIVDEYASGIAPSGLIRKRKQMTSASTSVIMEQCPCQPSANTLMTRATVA